MKTKTFIFYTLDEERPLLGQPVLVELNNNDDMKYYVCTLEECRDGTFEFCEAWGECYSAFPLSRVKCWASLE